MGNTIGSDAVRDPEGPGKDVAFFQAMNVRWLNVFITKIKDTKKSEFSLANNEETLKWSDYFRIFIDIKDSMGSESTNKERSNWHPATAGYAMTKRSPQEEGSDDSGEYTPVKSGKVPADDYTDDDPSEIGQEEFDGDDGDDQSAEWRPDSPDSGDPSSRRQPSQRPASARSRDAPRLPRHMDAQFTNPMFFGYTTETVLDQEKVIAAERALLRNRENRAIERARATRSVAIDALERTTQGQANLRLDKIKKLEEKYETARAKREIELERNEKELLASAFAIYERKWEMESQTAELAFAAEVTKMRVIHEEKTLADSVYLKNKREEMESFKDAEKQEIPAAERLEEFARIEVQLVFCFVFALIESRSVTIAVHVVRILS